MTNVNGSSFSTGALSSYKNPPVNKAVCRLRFDTSDKLRIPHIGFLWDKFRADYSVIRHAPPIASAKAEKKSMKQRNISINRLTAPGFSLSRES